MQNRERKRKKEERRKKNNGQYCHVVGGKESHINYI